MSSPNTILAGYGTNFVIQYNWLKMFTLVGLIIELGETNKLVWI